jgi:heat shock protein HslJ
VNGSGGCNRMFGSYELNGDALTFGDIGSTKMACPDIMDIESSFLPALQRAAKWRITGQRLDLLDSGGALVARFDAKPK